MLLTAAVDHTDRRISCTACLQLSALSPAQMHHTCELVHSLSATTRASAYYLKSSGTWCLPFIRCRKLEELREVLARFNDQAAGGQCQRDRGPSHSGWECLSPQLAVQARASIGPEMEQLLAECAGPGPARMRQVAIGSSSN